MRKSLLVIVLISSLTRCSSDTSESSNTQTKPEIETSTQGLSDAWTLFQQIVSSEDRKALSNSFNYPVGGDCMNEVLALMNLGRPLEPMDVEIHGMKMLTPEFKELVKTTTHTDLVIRTDDVSIYELALREEIETLEMGTMEYSTIFQFKLYENQLKIVAVYCAG